MSTTSRTATLISASIFALAGFLVVTAGCGGEEEGMTDVGEDAERQMAVTGCGPVCEKLCYIHLYRCRDKCDTTQTCETACYDAATSCHHGCGGDAACSAACSADQRKCSDACTLGASCDLACTKGHIKCIKGCACSEECITDYQCGPGQVCVGKPGNRRCLIPPEI